jgi:hypothetical protein
MFQCLGVRDEGELWFPYAWTLELWLVVLWEEDHDCTQLLGVVLSDDLKWNRHIDYICKKAAKRLYGLPFLKEVLYLLLFFTLLGFLCSYRGIYSIFPDSQTSRRQYGIKNYFYSDSLTRPRNVKNKYVILRHLGDMCLFTSALRASVNKSHIPSLPQNNLYLIHAPCQYFTHHYVQLFGKSFNFNNSDFNSFRFFGTPCIRYYVMHVYFVFWIVRASPRRHRACA